MVTLRPNAPYPLYPNSGAPPKVVQQQSTLTLPPSIKPASTAKYTPLSVGEVAAHVVAAPVKRVIDDVVKHPFKTLATAGVATLGTIALGAVTPAWPWLLPVLAGGSAVIGGFGAVTHGVGAVKASANKDRKKEVKELERFGENLYATALSAFGIKTTASIAPGKSILGRFSDAKAAVGGIVAKVGAFFRPSGTPFLQRALRVSPLVGGAYLAEESE